MAAAPQLDLFAAPPRAPKRTRAAKTKPAPESLDARFARWAAQNAGAIDSIRRAALAEAATGAPRLSIAKLAEELRADPRISTVGDEFKINNSYRAPLARLLMDEEPTLRGLFEVRERKARR